MNGVFTRIQSFIEALRAEGIPVSPADSEAGCRALLAVDWQEPFIFKAALQCTLVKDAALIPAFEQVYRLFFDPNALPWPEPLTEPGHELSRADAWNPDEKADPAAAFAAMLGRGSGSGASQPGESNDAGPRAETRPNQPGKGPKHKNPLDLDFYSAYYNGTPHNLTAMMALVPALARRLAARSVVKRTSSAASLDFRRTFRRSMSTGGIPAELQWHRKIKEKPVIFALCDISQSCLFYSAFSLGLVHSLGRFFRQVRSFAFIDQTDEITATLRELPPGDLRQPILASADVCGATGYTDYGASFASFLDQFKAQLTPESTVLIFGDARTNWFPARPELLAEIRRIVRRVYWFNPDPENEWNSGDSSMEIYRKHCHGAFSCATPRELADAIERML
ncbi:MAG: VWA domain-containing protein [Solirubrobacterales bacterium]